MKRLSYTGLETDEWQARETKQALYDAMPGLNDYFEYAGDPKCDPCLGVGRRRVSAYTDMEHGEVCYSCREWFDWITQ